MKIYSWNMLYRNTQLDRAFEFISQSDFDIFCLQEVPEEFLKRLQELQYSIVFRTDVERVFKNTSVHNYLVILSKYPICAKGEIDFPEYWHLLPLRTRLFVHLMPYRFFSKIRNRGCFYADVAIDGTSMRIFNLHLILAHPTLRLREFELAMMKRDTSLPTIVCGDFNTIESPHISILNWILGSPISYALFYRRERSHINKRFTEHKLVNPLDEKITHSISQSQLDHILVSDSFQIKKAVVLKDRTGSDHYPIYVEIE